MAQSPHHSHSPGTATDAGHQSQVPAQGQPTLKFIFGVNRTIDCEASPQQAREREQPRDGTRQRRHPCDQTGHHTPTQQCRRWIGRITHDQAPVECAQEAGNGCTVANQCAAADCTNVRQRSRSSAVPRGTGSHLDGPSPASSVPHPERTLFCRTCFAAALTRTFRASTILDV